VLWDEPAPPTPVMLQRETMVVLEKNDLADQRDMISQEAIAA